VDIEEAVGPVTTGVASEAVRFAVLGPVRAWRADVELDLGPRQQRLMLALLLVRADRATSPSEFVDLLWGHDAPASAVNVVHRYIGALRRVLEPDLPARASGRWLIRHPAGYQLDLAEDAVDLLRFRRLVDSARDAVKADDPQRAVSLFIQALGLSHGECAAGLGQASNASSVFSAVDQECVSVTLEVADTALRCGMAQQVLPILRGAAARDRFNEALQANLMQLLAAVGQQADAVGVYQEVRGHLADELGIDPGPALREAYASVLRQQPARPQQQDNAREDVPGADAEPPSAPPPAQPTPVVRPAQLPPDLSTFIGRQAESAQLLARVSSGRDTVLISAIDGMPGMGKTTLAVHWAHLVAEHFPDGQLYVDLRGFDPTGSVLDLAEALRAFLDALGMPTQRIPGSLAAQTGLYRSLLAGKRMLVVLDNARDIEQVRPLLPGTPGCLVIVTSRNRLTGLVASDGAHLVTLDVLSIEDARESLVRRLGAARVAADPRAADEIISLCARLPLALAIVAARATAHPQVPLASITAELREAHGSLDAFSDDSAGDVRAVFHCSYQLLSPPAARLFRLLSLHNGPDISRAAAGSLVGAPARELRTMVAELTRTGLLLEHQPGRYTSHDLIRAYAIELCGELDTDADRQETLGRMFDHYLHTAHAAHLLFAPHSRQRPPPTARPGVRPEPLADYPQALAWFGVEQHVLSAAVQNAADTGFGALAWQLALRLQQFHQHQGLYHDWSRTMGVALQAARAMGDVLGQAQTQRSLAGAYYFLGRTDESRALLEHTQELLTELGSSFEQAYVHSNLGTVLSRQGHLEDAVEHHEKALALYVAADHSRGQANALESIGSCHGQLGHHERAVTLIQQAMGLYRAAGDQLGEGNCWAGLGVSYSALGQHQQAARCRRRAIESYRRLGNRSDEADGLVSLGDSLRDAGDEAAARESWQQALVIFDELALPTATEVRARLSGLGEDVTCAEALTTATRRSP
jgi:DNA-binding SARP family transcriptional activator/tetratricopeptide (TPR) repeat protein